MGAADCTGAGGNRVPALPIEPGVPSPGRWRGRLRALLERTAALAVLPGDPEEVRVRKASLILLIVLLVPLSTVWVVIYGVLGLWWAAVIPLVYQVLSVIGLAALLRTKRFERFLTVELSLMLLLPFVLQWSLGGFRASSAVAAWAFVTPMAALVFVGPQRAWSWLAGWAVLLAVSTVLEFAAPDATELPQGLAISFFFLNIGGLSLVTYLLLRYFVQERERALAALDRAHRLLQVERAKSERLLLNVLPQSIAERLKEREDVIADGFSHVTVLFADIVGFTPYAERVPADASVQTLNELFSDFDALAKRGGLEKIKTIGDAYMVAGGLPEPTPDHAEAIADMGLEMLAAAARRTLRDGEPIQLRIGIDSGPVVAGVIGRRKFSYDLWGDTVNTASRMESHGVPGHIQVTERVRGLLADRFVFRERGTVEVKGKGRMRTYFLVGRPPGPSPV
jgi:adenylate cyclase